MCGPTDWVVLAEVIAGYAGCFIALWLVHRLINGPWPK